jgi:phage terminase large subunit GpA-like protein
MAKDAVLAFDQAIRRKVFALREPLVPSAWVERNISLPGGLHSRPGPLVLFPFQREPLDCIVEEKVSSLTLCWASQVLGKSLLLCSLIAWSAAERPGGIVLLLPTLDSASSWSRSKLGPLINDTPILRDLIQPATGRRQGTDTTSTTLYKAFPGGYLAIVGSNSDVGVSSHAARLILADEIDRFAVMASEEGDPLARARRRSETFPDAFHVAVSSPVLKDGRIEGELALSDDRRWHIKCLACEKPFVIGWEDVRWEKTSAGEHKPETARLVCPHCSERFTDAQRRTMVEAGKWIPTRPEAPTNLRGYHANAFVTLLPCQRGYSDRLHQWAAEWLDATKKGVDVVRTFVNTVHTLGWREQEQSAQKPEVLWGRREDYPADEADPHDCLLADKIRLVTVGADVQSDRLELETVGWSNQLESWSLDYRVIRGNLSQSGVWRELTEYLQQTRFPHPWGFDCGIDAACVDCGGHYTRNVFGFVATRPIPHCYAIKGKGLQGERWLQRSRAIALLYTISTDIVKRTVYDSLAVTVPGPGYMHLPAARDQLWYEQLVSERCVLRKINGVLVPRFELITGAHNEALDCRVYSRCAVEIIRPNWTKLEASFESRRVQTAAEAGEGSEESAKPVVERLKPEAASVTSGPNKPTVPAASGRRADGSRLVQRPRRGVFGW